MLAEKSQSPPQRAPQPFRDGLVELAHELALCQRQLWSLLMECLRPWELGPTEFVVLWLCERAAVHGVPQKDLVTASGVSSAQMSGVVEQLRRRGLLAAERGPQDRRQQLWHLADEGRRMVAELRTALAPAAEHLCERMSPLDTERLRELLQRLRAAAELQPLLGLFAPDTATADDDRSVPGGAS
jgi:DNA-binding MarR family transcriptional regulator